MKEYVNAEEYSFSFVFSVYSIFGFGILNF